MFGLAFLLYPAYTMFFLGMLLRKTSVFDDAAAGVLFKLVHHLTLPALLLSVLPYVVISRTMLLLPLVSILLILVTVAAATLTGKVSGMTALLDYLSSIFPMGESKPLAPCSRRHPSHGTRTCSRTMAGQFVSS